MKRDTVDQIGPQNLKRGICFAYCRGYSADTKSFYDQNSDCVPRLRDFIAVNQIIRHSSEAFSYVGTISLKLNVALSLSWNQLVLPCLS